MESTQLDKNSKISAAKHFIEKLIFFNLLNGEYPAAHKKPNFDDFLEEIAKY